MKQYLEAGKIVNTHGVAGMVKIESWCDSPQILAGLHRLYFEKNGNYTERRIIRTAVHKGMVLVHFEGFTDFDQAAALRNQIVYCDRSDVPMPDGGHFIADLIGLPCLDHENGTVYGKLKDVLQSGPQDLYEIETPDGRTAYVPVVEEFVIKVDLEKGIFLKPIPGMFDEI